MKLTKIIVSVLLATLMVLSMSSIVFADGENGTITINGTEVGKTYELYRIFDMTVADNGNIAYTINSDWVDFFNGAGAEYITDTAAAGLSPFTAAFDADGKFTTDPAATTSKATRFINVTEENVVAFCQAAQNYAMNNATAVETVDGAADTTVVTVSDLGFYIILPVGADIYLEGNSCICTLTPNVPNATVNVKADYIDGGNHTSKVALDATGADLTNAQVGDTVYYKVTSKLPDIIGYTTYDLIFTDSSTSGLTFDGLTTVDVTVGDDVIMENGSGNKYATIATANGANFKLTLDAVAIWADKEVAVGDEIVITYTAKLNDAASGTVQTNTMDFDKVIDGETVDLDEKSDDVWSSKIVINKYDAADEDVKLADAKFVLINDAGEYYVDGENDVNWVAYDGALTVAGLEAAGVTIYTTDDNGVATFNGLADGEYKLIEVVAPAGYNLLPNPVDVTVDGTGDPQVLVIETDVANYTGTVLPTTGGMGTAIFYVVGAILVVGAAVLLITKKRMSAREQ